MKKAVLSLALLALMVNLVLAQNEENLTYKSSYKEKIKTEEGSSDIYAQDNYVIKAVLDLENIGFDPATIDENTQLRILFEATPGERYAIWQNDGKANFTDIDEFIGDSDYNDIALGDLNNDGKVDAVLVTDEANEIWQRDDEGDYINSGLTIGLANSDKIYLGDMDGDGDLDAVLKNDLGHEIWLNDGNMVFTNSGNIIGTENAYYIVLGQIDGNNYMDAVVIYDGYNQVWLNDGTGKLINSGKTLGHAGDDVYLADVTGDGKADAILRVTESSGDDDDDDDAAPAAGRAISTTTANQIWINDGNATFTDSGKTIGPEDSDDLFMGDVNNNGTIDAIVNVIGVNQIWLNDGAANFTDSGKIIGSEDTGMVVALGDVTGNGFNSAVLGEAQINDLHVYNDFVLFDEILGAAKDPKSGYSEKFSKYKVTDKGGSVKFVNADDVGEDKEKWKKTQEIIASWNAKKLTVEFKGKPPLDYYENIFDFSNEVDELVVDETNKVATQTYNYETNCKIWFAGHRWQSTELEYTVTVTRKYKGKKVEGEVEAFELDFWDVNAKGELDYVK